MRKRSGIDTNLSPVRVAGNVLLVSRLNQVGYSNICGGARKRRADRSPVQWAFWPEVSWLEIESEFAEGACAHHRLTVLIMAVCR